MLTIATIYPELLGTYGDGGNALVLAERARRRGIETESVPVTMGSKLPDAAMYLLGGGEDGPQRQATEALRHDGTLAARVADGAMVLAVCAGLQILGTRFGVHDGGEIEGLGLLDAVTRRSSVRRVGDVLVETPSGKLVGFENHGGVTELGECEPLGAVVKGFGNDGVVDGVAHSQILGTYAHGPVLALNPWLADQLLERALGHALEPLATVADQLYVERCRRVSQAVAARP